VIENKKKDKLWKSK